MALDFSKYLEVDVESIERPAPPPPGHYFAAIKSWKTREVDYKQGAGPQPVVSITFGVTAADDDVDQDLLPLNGLNGVLVSKDYSLNDELGLFQLRKLGEDTCKLPTKGLHLGDLLPMLIGCDVKVLLDQRADKDGNMFPQVKGVLPAE